MEEREGGDSYTLDDLTYSTQVGIENLDDAAFYKLCDQILCEAPKDIELQIDDKTLHGTIPRE